LQIYNEKVFDLLNSSSITNMGAKRIIGGNTSAGFKEGLRVRWSKKD
jgi:hypothetical protein